MSESKYPDWYHGPRGPSDEVKAQRKISARLKRIEAKLDAIGTAPQEAQADPKKDVCPNCGEVANGCNYCRKTPAPVPQTEGESPDCGGTGRIRRQKDWRIDPCSFCSGTGYQLAVNDALAALTQKGDKE